jgi:hypothetical protein
MKFLNFPSQMLNSESVKKSQDLPFSHKQIPTTIHHKVKLTFSSQSNCTCEIPLRGPTKDV